VSVRLQLFLTSSLVRSAWSYSRPCHFNSVEWPYFTACNRDWVCLRFHQDILKLIKISCLCCSLFSIPAYASHKGRLINLLRCKIFCNSLIMYRVSFMLLYSELNHMPWRMVSLGSGVVVRELWYISIHGIGVDEGWSWFLIHRHKHKHNLNKELNTLSKSDCLLNQVCPTVLMEQLGSHRTYFHEMWYLSIFLNSVEKVKLSLKSDKI